ncbi:hypothetical protein ACSQ67_000969 [Phaseolus vulgaris]
MKLLRRVNRFFLKDFQSKELGVFDSDYALVRHHLDHQAEALVHLFCVVSRKPLTHDNLLFHYSDQVMDLLQQLVEWKQVCVSRHVILS